MPFVAILDSTPASSSTAEASLADRSSPDCSGSETGRSESLIPLRLSISTSPIRSSSTLSPPAARRITALMFVINLRSLKVCFSCCTYRLDRGRMRFRL